MYNFLRQGFENIPVVHGPHGEVILNLSKRELDRIEPVPSNVNVLILDHNYIRRLENLGNLYDLQQLSLSGNKLLQMHGVASLTHLTILNLPNNGIVAIDGLLKLNRLRWLNLSGNRIKIMDQLDGNLNLKHLDLSENCIVQLGDISNLRKLTTLLLHANRITSLENASKYLPHCLEIFSMAGNSLIDIDEVRKLSCLRDLVQFSIQNNPCTNCVTREFEPQVLCALPNLRILDGSPVVRENAPLPTQRVGIAPPPHSSVTEREVLHSEVIAQQQQQHPMPTSPMQLLDSVNTQDTAIQQPVSQPSGVSQLEEAYAGRCVPVLPPPPPVAPLPATPGLTAQDSPSRGSSYVKEPDAPNSPSKALDTRDSVASGLRSSNAVAPKPSPESTAISAHSTTPDHAYSTRSGCAFDDIPVASVWALTNSKAVPSSSREPVPTRPTGEELPGSTKLNGYPDRGSFVVNNLSSPTPRHISDEDFIQSSSSRAAVAQGQLNGHMVVYGRDPSTASSLLMSESVYLPLASTSLSPDQPPLGMEPTMSRSTPLCSLGPQNMMDPVRPSRNNTVMDSLDGTTSIPELESSRTTVRLSDQSRIPVDTLHSSNNSNQMNRLSDQAGPSSIPHSVAHASPPEFSVHTDIRPKSVLAHHKLIDSVHLLNDEEEEEEDENIATNDDGKRTAGVDDETDGNVKAYNTVDQERTNESALTMGTGTVKFRPSDLLDSDCPWGPLERGCPVEKTNGAKSLDPLENLIHQISPERILGIPTNTASISGSRQLRSVRDPSSSMESVSKSIETLRSEQSPKIIVPYMNSKSLDSNWFRVPDPEVGPDCSTRTEISSLNPPATSPNPIASYSMPSGLSAVRPVPLTRHSLSRPDFPASTDAVTPTPPEKDRRLAGNHLAGSASNYVDCVGGRRSRARSASRSSATYSRSNSEAPCTSCGMSYRVLRDHVVFLRTQLQAQYKATQAEARMRQLHSNAIEFLLKEVQELKTWKESVSQLLPDIQSPSNNTIGRVDKHQPIAPVPQIHASNDVIPSGPLVSRLQESITAQPIRPKKAISARGDSPLWSKLQATPRAVSTSSGPLDVCFDNTTYSIPTNSETPNRYYERILQLFARIDPATSLRSTTGSQNEVVKVYASDEDEQEESSNRAVQLADSPPPHLQPVISNPGRSRSETAPSSLQCTNSHVARYVNGFGFSSDSGCVHSTDEALDEIELVRQAAMQAINLSTSLSDGEVETPRQSESTIAANCDQTVVETTGEITVSSLTTNRTA